MPNPDAAPSLLQVLRDATHAAHEEIDAAFSAIDLNEKAGYSRFLSAHLVGIAAVSPFFRQFTEQELQVEAPDFPAMLRLDLEELEIDSSSLPVLQVQNDPAGAAICYVVAGSRLGVAALGNGSYWQKGSGTASRYMENRQGLRVWRALVDWMRDQNVGGDEAQRHCATAIATFHHFRQALSATAMRIS